MSDPNSFVSFADWLGLNNEAGQEMLQRTSAGGQKLRADAMSASDAHYAASRGAGEGGAGAQAQYDRTGEATRKGLASYGEFMQGMADPGARQALMEKTYGRGVTRFDSLLAGAAGGGQLAKDQQQFQTDRSNIEARGMDADQRRDRYSAQTADRKAGEAQDLARRQTEADVREKDRLGRKYFLDNDGHDAGTDRFTVGMSKREREMNLESITRESGFKNAKTGAVDWEGMGNFEKRYKQYYYDNRPKTFWGGEIDLFGPKPVDPSTKGGFAEYYAKNKTGGGK